jgi:hypothetical protein
MAVAVLTELSAAQLRDALRAGIYQLYRRTDHINNINVFPVPDGDTGTNMAMTLASVLAALEGQRWEHSGRMLVRAADAALDGARGNSGAILAQFLLGAADRAAGLTQLKLSEFSHAIEAGASNARLALTQPREGTILSVITAFAQALAAVVRSGGSDFRLAFRSLMPSVQASLAATPEQLEELRAANVVDAGAAGFVELLDGMGRYLETGEVSPTAAPVHCEDVAMAEGGSAGEHRFCIECMVAGRDIDLRLVRERLNALGSSLVVSGHPSKLRVHLHSNDPALVFAAAEAFGVVSAQKVDDMLLQQHAAHHDRRRKVAVTTDSAADIPAAALERLDIHVVPVRVHFGPRSFLDKVTLTPDDFYRRLAESTDHPKTSQPPPGDFRRMYEFLASHYAGVVSINLTAKASGTWNAALGAAERVAGNKIHVLDSRNASLGQGLIVTAAAECAAAGGGVAEVKAAAEAAIAHTSTFALLGRLDFAVRGGRVPRFVKVIADFLHCSPILSASADGKVGIGGVIWGRRHARSRFARFVCRRMRADRRYRLIVGHGNAESEAQAMLDEIRAVRGDLELIELTTTGPALGVHGGPGLLVVAFQEIGAR